MPHKLVDLEIDEISGVDRPASHRKFLIIKRDGEGESMSAWDEIQKRAAASGQSVAEICQGSPELYKRHVREQRRGEVNVPEVSSAKPIVKHTTSSDAMLTLAKAKLLEGEAKTMLDALELVHQQHPSLYAQHREGK